MPEVKVGRKIFRAPLVHYIEDSGMSLCGKPAKVFQEPPNKTKKPEPCEMCFAMAATRPDIDHEWFIDEIDGVRYFYG